MNKIQFHIEGDADLRQGFRILLGQKLKKDFNINMGGPREVTVKNYKNDKTEKKFLVIDLENHPTNRDTEIGKLALEAEKSTCFMVQKMEAWFIAQADKLFESEVAGKLGKGNPEYIDNPDKKLKETLYNHRGKAYDKKGDAIKFLQKLDIAELGKKFKDVEILLNNFANA